MAGRELPLGPTGETVRANIARFRELRGLSYAELARTLDRLDRAVPPLGLRRIESGERRVDVDELVALAVAFGVNPNAILLPPYRGPEARTELTAFGEVVSDDAWDWANGVAALVGPSSDAACAVEYMRDAQPQVALPKAERAAVRRRFLEGQAAELRAELERARGGMEAADGVEVGRRLFRVRELEKKLAHLESLDPLNDPAWQLEPNDPAPPVRSRVRLSGDALDDSPGDS